MPCRRRNARIVSLSFPVGEPWETVVAKVETEAAQGTDLIALPETWLGQVGAEPIDGTTIATMAGIAARYATYIVCTLDRTDGLHRLNSAVLIDRSGSVAGVYDKVYPYWGEFDLDPAVAPGIEPVVVQTDFGRVGLAICFDVNFPWLWQAMADQDADLVIWPSAYSAGTALMAHALNHHYYIVTATSSGDCQVFDITGRKLFDERSDGITVSRISLDLDRAIFHHNFNLAKCDILLREHAGEVEQEEFFEREHWFVLRSTSPDVSVRELASAYGLEELRAYKERSRQQIDAMRASGMPLPVVELA